MTQQKPSYEELLARAQRAEAILDTIFSGQVDSIAGNKEDIISKFEETQKALGKRLKELNCLFNFSQIIENNQSIPDILQETVEILPESWQYPEMCCASIEFEGKKYYKASLCDKNCTTCSHQNQRTEIYVNGKKAGGIKVSYVKHMPEEDEGPFLTEERKLLDAIGKRLGHVIERISGNKDLFEASERLAASEKRYRNLFDSMLDAFAVHEIILDDNGKPVDYRFLLINPAFEKMTGLTSEKIVGRTVLEVLPGVEFSWIEKYGKVALTGESIRFEDFSGELKKHFEVYAFQYEYGKFAVVFKDVTESKELEIKMRQMEKMDSIGQLAGGVAHDFNNQLAGIMGYADMLCNRLEDKKLHKYAERILVGARRAADLTQQLLAFAHKGQYRLIPVNIHETISEVVSILEHSIDKRIEIQQIFKASPPLITGDPSQIQNAVLNVAINSRDAMPEGGILIFETDTKNLDSEYCNSLPYNIEPGSYLSLCITDNGCGMDEDTKARIFEPFFTTKETGQGTGMGLAAVYGTIKNHGGAINVYSEIGHGTTIRIYLPTAEKSQIKQESVKKVTFASRSANIMIVDDEDTFRNVAVEILEETGYSTVTANDGGEAVEYYKSHWREIDIIILDMIMPVLGGKEAFFEMQKINPELKVILASGYSLNGTAQGLLHAGVKGFIQKPFDLSDLTEKIAVILNESNS